MAGFVDNLDENFLMAYRDPEWLADQIPDAVALFGAEIAVAKYKNPASAESVQLLEDRIAELYSDVAGVLGLSKEKGQPVNAQVSKYAFVVTPTAMRGFLPYESNVEKENSGFKPDRLITTGSSSISILKDTDKFLAVFEQTRETVEEKNSLLRNPKIVPDPALNYHAKVPATEKDIAAAIRLISWADPLRYPKQYIGETS